MKIAFCIFKFFPWGGLQRDFLRIAKIVASLGHEVRVYTRSWDGHVSPPKEFNIILVPTRSCTNHGKNLDFIRWIQNDLRTHPVDTIVGFDKIPGIDIYYAGDVCYAEKSRNKNFIYKLSPRYRANITIEKAVFDKGSKTKILFLTEKSVISYKNFYEIEENRFTILPPGAPVDRKYIYHKKNSRSEIRQKLRIPENSFLLLQIGSDFYRKGLDRSITALASLPTELKQRTYLCAIGQDNPQKFLTEAAKFGIADHLRIFSGREDVSDFIAASDLFLHPARSEAAGIAILEALIGGLPQIITDVCGYSTYVEQAASGIVLPSPFDQLVFNNKLSQALSNDELRHIWALKAKKFSDTHDLYSLPETVASIILGDTINENHIKNSV